jgi:hypothetical protein
MIERIKWALQAFEGFRLEDQFNKSKLITLNIDLTLV